MISNVDAETRMCGMWMVTMSCCFVWDNWNFGVMGMIDDDEDDDGGDGMGVWSLNEWVDVCVVNIYLCLIWMEFFVWRNIVGCSYV